MNSENMILDDILINELIKHIKEKTIIPEEIMDSFVMRSMLVAQKEESKHISRYFRDLKIVLREAVDDNREDSRRTHYSMFQLGEISSCVSMINQVLVNEEEKESLTELNTILKKNVGLFSAISAKEGGIRHSELAAKIGKSPSGLSQLMSQFKYNDFITHTSIGREKYYFLTEKGRAMLLRVQNEIEQNAKNAALAEKTKKSNITGEIVKEETYKVALENLIEFLNLPTRYYDQENLKVTSEDDPNDGVGNKTVCKTFKGIWKLAYNADLANSGLSLICDKSLWNKDVVVSDFGGNVVKVVEKAESLKSSLNQKRNSFDESISVMR